MSEVALLRYHNKRPNNGLRSSKLAEVATEEKPISKFPPLTAPLAAVMATVIKLWTNLFDDDDDIAHKETDGQEK